VRISGDAEGSSFCWVTGANLDLRYGITAPDKTRFTWSFELEPEDGHEVTASMKDDSLISTVSSAGTWLKRMGLSETASTAGRERDVCGCAARPMSKK
jgi:hypothetical protein